MFAQRLAQTSLKKRCVNQAFLAKPRRFVLLCTKECVVFHVLGKICAFLSKIKLDFSKSFEHPVTAPKQTKHNSMIGHAYECQLIDFLDWGQNLRAFYFDRRVLKRMRVEL